jgi:formylglycine-generating enzyme required for sulfatase activity
MEISIPLITAFFGLLGMSFGAATLSQPPAHRYAAVVAVGGYEDPWQHLNTAISGGNAVRSLLHDGLGFQALKLLRDPTKPDLDNWLDKLPQDVTDADELVVFVTGHGTSDGDFVLVDGQFAHVQALLSRVFSVPVPRILVILDFCYSAGYVQPAYSAAQAQIHLLSGAPKVRQIIAAGSAQISSEGSESLEYSPFVRHFLDYFDRSLPDFMKSRVVTAQDLANALADSEKDKDQKAKLELVPGASRDDFTFDLDGKEINGFREAVAKSQIDAGPLRAYARAYPHGLFLREAWARINSIEKQIRESYDLEFQRGSLTGGDETDVWVNLKDGLEYAWVPTTTEIKLGKEKLGAGESQKRDYGGFWMTQTEVPVSAYQGFAKNRNLQMPRAPGFNRRWRTGGQPMVNVSLAETASYCAYAGGRLPTEAEWEYAARAQRNLDTDYFGMGRAPGFTNLRGKLCRPVEAGCDTYEDVAPVDGLTNDVNAWSLFGMAGNVSEITAPVAGAPGGAADPNPQSSTKMWVRGPAAGAVVVLKAEPRGRPGLKHRWVSMPD